MTDINYVTVSQLNKYVKFRMDNDSHLKTVYLKGELSNYKRYPNGNHFFTIKDENASISAVMFSYNTSYLKFLPEDGMKVLVKGKVTLYQSYGRYQIEVSDMDVDGVGNLYIAYEQLKKKLKREGYFDEEFKVAIPKFPTRIGVVTAETGAAIRDIITTIKRRWPFCEIYVFPSLVQGKGSAENIARQIRVSQYYNLDTLIVGRGGGSIEDLWSFNEEVVAKAIFESKTPVISAVGHEVDFTIADFVADKRAPTPTAAGEMAVPDYNEIKSQIEHLNIRLTEFIKNQLDSFSKRLNSLKDSNIFRNPEEIYIRKELDLDRTKERLKYGGDRLIKDKEQVLKLLKESYALRNPYILTDMKELMYVDISKKLKMNADNLIKDKETSLVRVKDFYTLRNPYTLIDKKEHKYLEAFNKLELLNPMLTLKRGYALAKKDDKIISESKGLKKGDKLKIEFSDGNIDTKVI